MSDDRSTPISSLNNQDDSEVVSKVLDKYNHLSQNDHGEMASSLMPRPQPSGDILEMPPLHPDQRQLEEKFENRDFNSDIYKLSARDPILVQQYDQQVRKSKDYQRSNQETSRGGGEEEDYEDYDEYEVMEEEPYWRRMMNEMRIIFFIVLFVTLFFNCNFGVDKFLCKYPFFGNANYDCNWKGVLLKSILVGIFSYMAIRFIRV